ncbi:hypothetical protein [Paraburkholderia unamae]|uniref:Uncharacterized protein n=1 Tax=Paraburkholderia unamae TaxID=219649 RepID=A0ACC6RRI5_9BURK
MDILNAVLVRLGGIAGILAALCIGAALVFRKAITDWLTKRVAKGLERDADRYRHELSRDMEKYKDELTRAQNVERFKGEIRKAVAERILERRLAALHEVDLALGEIPTWVVTQMAIPLQGRSPLTEFTQKISELGGVLTRHSLYFDAAFQLEYRQYVGALNEHAGQWPEQVTIGSDDPRTLALLRTAGKLQLTVEGMHRQLPDVLADSMIDGRPTQPPADAPPA